MAVKRAKQTSRGGARKNWLQKRRCVTKIIHLLNSLTLYREGLIYDQGLRIHFEWVWNGKTIYLVQADREQLSQGVDPTKVYLSNRSMSSVFIPKCLKEIRETDDSRYNKIRNVFTYLKLGLPITKLYVLDDQAVINDLASGYVSSDLKKDISELIRGSLVIRMDIATDDTTRRQLLPRTNEVREYGAAINFLKENSALIKKSDVNDDVVFIFHNFVPAVASAFAYAAPRERNVQIEALWGLPEGLYYNSHDKYIVDTKTSRAKDLCSGDIDQFTVREKRYCKHFFVTPNEAGQWVSESLPPPFDWKGVIQDERWIKEIAFESRRIAEEEGTSLSIMWFVGVESGVCDRPIFPWFHEHYDTRVTSRAQKYRTKTPFDKSLKIKTNADVKELMREASSPMSRVRRIKIQPTEDKLLRDKSTLREIGKLAKKIASSAEFVGKKAWF